MFIWRNQRDGFTAFACACGPAGAVHIALFFHRDIIIDYMGNVLDINAPGRHIRSDQIAELASLKSIHHFKPLVLHHSPVDLVHRKLLIGHAPEQRIHLILGTAKNNTAIRILHRQQIA
ncbi:hypothetical protein D3C81_1296750 [compost metagenome]